MSNKVVQNVLIHLILISVMSIILIINNSVIVLFSSICLYLLYLFMYKGNIQLYCKYIKYVSLFSLLIFIIFFLISHLLINSIIVFIKFTFIINTFLYFFSVYSVMDIFYALERFLYVIEFLGYSSTRVAWCITRYIRNTKMWLKNFISYHKVYIYSDQGIEKNIIYGKINSMRHYLMTVTFLTKEKAKALDDMMYLRMFRTHCSRTNYKMNDFRKREIIFIIIIFIILISEVVICDF